MGDVDGREVAQLCLGVAGHFLKGLVCCDVAPVGTRQSHADRDVFEQIAPAIFAHLQFGVEPGVLQRNRRLRRQQFQHRDPRGREHVRCQVVLEIEHADQPGLLDQGQTKHRPRAASDGCTHPPQTGCGAEASSRITLCCVRITVWSTVSGSAAGVTGSCRSVTSIVLSSVLASASICSVSPRRRMSRPRSAPACSSAIVIRVSMSRSSTISPETACEALTTAPMSN